MLLVEELFYNTQITNVQGLTSMRVHLSCLGEGLALLVLSQNVSM